MLTYWETLIARKSNITVSDSYAKLWGKKSQGGYTVETYTGTLPATLQTVEGHLESYKIYGNTAQDGTPTPENPIVPSGCGELETTGVHTGQYKLPLTVNGVECPIYLGESQTTRKIKKYIFTGNENGTIYGTSTSRKGIKITRIPGIIGGNADIAILAICTHYQPDTRSALYRNTNNGISNSYQNDSIIFYDANCQTVESFQQFCTQQYASGTPVTVWYVLAEPETAVVNEPLMKIGGYADTIDSTQSTVRIPTAAGETTISWAGEGLAPSEVEFVYKVKG